MHMMDMDRSGELVCVAISLLDNTYSVYVAVGMDLACAHVLGTYDECMPSITSELMRPISFSFFFALLQIHALHCQMATARCATTFLITSSSSAAAVYTLHVASGL
jgi:hypothetical protein